MTQVYLIRHGETEWNVARKIQGQTDSNLTQMGESQARQAGMRLQNMGITHIIASDLGRTRRTAELLAEYCQIEPTFDARLRELNMGILEQRCIDTLTEEEEHLRLQILNGNPDGRIPEGESLSELTARMRAVLDDCKKLPQGSRPVLVSHGIALGSLLGNVLGLPPYAERRLRLRNCSLSLVEGQNSPWLAPGWVVEFAGDTQHLTANALDEIQR
ncbi:2,3-diphosphoglycerate-dependent phosphoglycerate mutase GpmB [Pragia fontium]|uniref:2,3-diphosphoglycerate-dependent phosphoglycerate mutase GpmB n=1 Tax=Pragia fontium TaxID=82985 RepID=UPI00064B7935|nr:2,3-diphosphoglycerate-dependent phosphoglycerate mutase GpmB [Pragia fontium]AKJ41319.1 phosphoglycerate mutase [Pragia fontium]